MWRVGVGAIVSFTMACGARSELDGKAPSIADASVPEVANDVAVPDAQSDGGITITVIAEGSPFAIAVDDDRIYWSADMQTKSEEPAVVACAKTGCGGNPTTIMVTLADGAGSIDPRAHTLAVNATNVYWIAGRPTQQGPAPSILTCPKTGCTTAEVFAPGVVGDRFVGIATNDTDVYWTFGGYGGNSGASLRTCAAAGCQGAPTTYADHQTTGDLAIDGDELVWPNLVGVVKCPLAGCTQPTLISSVHYFPTSMAAAGGNAAWARAGGVEDCVQNCATKPTLLASDSQPGAVATDGTNIYWVAQSLASTTPNAIMKCSLTHCNGSPQTLATFQGTSGGIAVDGTSVYWTITNQNKNQQDGSVMKLTPK